MVLDKNSSFGTISIRDFDVKLNATLEDVDRLNNKDFWPLVENYILKDVQILHRSLLELEKMFNSIGYSITDRKYHGMASISFDKCLSLTPCDSVWGAGQTRYDRSSHKR
jgi:hypothetical protein